MTVQHQDVLGSVPVPTGVLRDATLSAGARALYAILLSYAHGTAATYPPTQETLAADVGCSVRTVQRLLHELQATDLVRVRQQGLSLPNAYEIFSAPPSAGD